MEYGLQLYSMRDSAEKDLRNALALCAEMGYAAVEFAGFFGCSAADVRSWMNILGLRVSGTHTGAGELEAELLPQTIAYHKAIGNHRIIIPGADLSTAEKLDAFIDLVNKVQPILAKEGIALGYHNHSHEFLPNLSGQTIHEELEKRTSLLFEIDTFWAWNAGCDPMALLNRLGERIPVIHLKDGVRGAAPEDAIGKPLGQGDAPLEEILACAAAHGMEIVVESETLTPDGPTEARTCIRWLQNRK